MKYLIAGLVVMALSAAVGISTNPGDAAHPISAGVYFLGVCCMQYGVVFKLIRAE